MLLAAACLAAMYIAPISAGDYRGKPRPEVPQEWATLRHKPVPELSYEDLPDHFNWCDNDGENYCTPNWNQHVPVYCGACWAHGTLSALNDRLKIAKKARGPDVMLSRQTLLNCATYEGLGNGCDGGDPIHVFKYMDEFGLPDESCMPYNATDHKKFDPSLAHCPASAYCANCMPVSETSNDTHCWPVETPVKYYLDHYGKVPAASNGDYVLGMMQEIYQRGPITCGVATPDEFVYNHTWNGEVWQGMHTATKKDIDHDVELVGWGELDGIKYWKIRNSWGTYWGDLGFFKLERGTNSLYIENNDCWYAEPSYEMEEDVLDRKLEGTMYGLKKNPDYHKDHHHKHHHDHEEHHKHHEHDHKGEHHHEKHHHEARSTADKVLNFVRSAAKWLGVGN